MTNNKTLTIRLNPTLKDQFSAVCEDMGLSVSSVFGLFAKAVVRERKIPFEIKADSEYVNGLPVSEHIRRIEEIDKGNAVTFTAEQWDKWVADNA
jgi:DNA-damage-inducible protein J